MKIAARPSGLNTVQRASLKVPDEAGNEAFVLDFLYLRHFAAS